MDMNSKPSYTPSDKVVTFLMEVHYGEEADVVINGVQIKAILLQDQSTVWFRMLGKIRSLDEGSFIDYIHDLDAVSSK